MARTQVVRRRPAVKISEKQFQDRILAFCRWTGLRAYHVYDSRKSAPGFPDLVIVGPKGVIFAELKSATGKLSEHQRDWLHDLARAGQKTFVWRPSDWGQVEKELRQLL